MTANEVRESFKKFFEGKGHKIVPSAPMVIKDDPTLMFTNAGMNQWKDIILGTREPEPRRRVAGGGGEGRRLQGKGQRQPAVRRVEAVDLGGEAGGRAAYETAMERLGAALNQISLGGRPVP